MKKKQLTPWLLLRNLLISYGFGWLVFSETPKLELTNPTPIIQEVVRKTTSELERQALTNKKLFRIMLKKHFPEFKSRVDYQQQMRKLYASGKKKLTEAKKVGAIIKPTEILIIEEQDAFDYINGAGVYEKFQNPKILPNIYDARQSFLLKMEDSRMRYRFFESYNREESID